MKLAALLLCFSAVLAHTQTKRSSAPDVIFINGNIYVGAIMSQVKNGTENPKIAVTVLPRAQAMALKDGRITAVGTNEAVKKLKGSHTQAIDLGGHFVMPGFNDAHLHLANGGFEKLNVDLVGSRSLPDMLSRIAARVKRASPGEWINGRGWDHTLWPGQKLPTRQDLDSVTEGHPAIFTRVDGHISVANSAALRQAGIAKDTPNPPGGSIDRDITGEATGILRETAREPVYSKIPRPTPAQRRRAIELALRDAVEHGVTSIQDNSEWDDFLVYEDLEREGKLILRITEWLPFNAPVSMLQDHRAHHLQTDSLLHTGMLKGFMDGSLGSRTAALLQPYSDDPNNSGLPQYQQAKLNEMSRERVQAGFQLGFHAIGDGGVQMALDAFAEGDREAREANLKQPNSPRPTNDFRFRVEHAQVVAPQQFAPFRTMGVIASMQPNHLLTDMNWAESRIGPERARNSYAWRHFLDDGTWLAFGTDYPVEPITPFRGLYAAVTRKNEAGTKEYFPDQKLSVDEAIAAYTTGSAYAEFAEHEKGTLQPGMLADFVVLDRDLTKIMAPEIFNTHVLRTVLGGHTVYQRSSE